MASWPTSRFAKPQGSFNLPVPPPVPGGTACDHLQVNFPQEWLPYILAALEQLTLQSTWQGSTTVVEQTQAMAWNILKVFQNAICVTPNPSGEGIHGGEDDDMSCPCWRIQNGMLQFLCCGVWEDVIPVNGNGQPGAGSPQPIPGGGSQDYCMSLVNGSLTHLPTLVNTGDTILIENWQGLSYDDEAFQWFAANGWKFLLGTLVPGSITTDAANPLPTAPDMQIIAKIGSTYYDVFNQDSAGNPQVFTVPGGVVNQPVDFLVNDHAPTLIGGQLTFCAKVTNNQPVVWRALLDFTISDWGFTIDNLGTAYPEAQYYPGSGWGQVAAPAMHQDHIAIVNLSLPSTEYTHVEMVMDAATVWAAPLFRLYSPASGYTAFASDTVNTVDQVFSFSPYTDVGLRMQTCNDPEQSPVQVVSSRIKQLKLAGTGVNPFPGAPTW